MSISTSSAPGRLTRLRLAALPAALLLLPALAACGNGEGELYGGGHGGVGGGVEEEQKDGTWAVYDNRLFIDATATSPQE